MAGKKQGVGYVRGFVIPGTRYPLPVISSYHPAEIARGKTNLLSVQALDFHRAVYYAQHGFDWTKDRPRRRYILFPSPIEAEIWAREYLRQPSSTVLMYDIETEETSTTVDEVDIRVLADGRLQIMSYPDDTRETVEALERDEEAGEDVGPRVEIKAQCMITQIQFSWKSGEAIVLPWTSSYDRAIRMLLEDRGHLKAGWNSYHFDNPLLRAHGFELQGPLHDAMWLWHHLQPDLPRGLQFVCSCYMPWVEPWKHRTDNMGQYGGDDVSHLAEFFYPMYDALDQNGVRRAYDEHVVALWSELDAAAQLGIGVDEQARVEFVDELELARVELLLKIQELVPEQLRNIEPKLGYKKPKDAEKRRLVTKLDPGEKWVQQEIEGELRWARLQPFLPTSPQQLIRYIKYKTDQAIDERVEEYRSNARWSKLTEPELRLMAAKNVKWKVPKTRDGKDTTGKKELDRLRKATGDEFFKVNVEYREIVKAKGTYGEGWKPGKDGRVHTTFGYSPATGQLSSRGPNVQNCPK